MGTGSICGKGKKRGETAAKKSPNETSRVVDSHFANRVFFFHPPRFFCREIKNYAKRQTANVIFTTWPSFSLYYRLLFITSTKKKSSFTLVLYITIVLNSFNLLKFNSEKFSTWIWRFPFSINVNLNFSFFTFFLHYGAWFQAILLI